MTCRPIASWLQGTIFTASELGPFSGSPWIQLVAAAASSCLGRLELEHHSMARSKPWGTEGCCSQTGGFSLTSCLRFVFPTQKLGSESFAWKVCFLLLLPLLFVAWPFPLHLAFVVILPCSIKPVGGIAQKTDLELWLMAWALNLSSCLYVAPYSLTLLPFFFFFLNFWGTFFREATAWEGCLISKFCWWC